MHIRRIYASTLSAMDGAGDDGRGRTSAVPAADRRQLWMAAIKPSMYSVGVMPVLVAAATAYAEHGACGAAWRMLFSLIPGAICIIAWVNLSNDGFDASTGVDATKPESVVNLTGSRGGVLLAAHTFLALGAFLLHLGSTGAGDLRVQTLLAAAIACGHVYQGPPFRLSYKGLGEPLCFAAFGPLITPAFYLALAPHMATAATATSAASTATHAAAGLSPPPAAAAAAGTTAAEQPLWPPPLLWLLSCCLGTTTSVILFCSHFHQIKGDAAAGKMSPLVKLGTERGCQVLAAATAAPYCLLAGATLVGGCPLLLPATALLLSWSSARELLRFAYKNHRVPARIAPLKRYAIKWHVAFSFALVLALIGGRALGLP